MGDEHCILELMEPYWCGKLAYQLDIFIGNFPL